VFFDSTACVADVKLTAIPAMAALQTLAGLGVVLSDWDSAFEFLGNWVI